MESSAAVEAHERATGSTTIADLIELAAERHAGRPALRYKQDGAWKDVSYAELGETVSEVGRGLIDLGIEPGDRVAILCQTRREWTYADFGITSTGAVAVPIYPTNSPEECQWVAGNSESRAIVCENAEQVAKIRAVQADLPALETIIVVEPAAGDAKRPPNGEAPPARRQPVTRPQAEAGSEARQDDVLTLDELRERGRG